MLLFKISQLFFLPSIFTKILILAGIIFLVKDKKQKIGRILVVFGVVLYYIFSITPTSDLILLPLEEQYQPIQENEIGKADKIVLLLGGKESNILRASEVLKIYHITTSRCLTGCTLDDFKIIISGRDPLDAKMEEGEQVKKFLTDRGILPESIILENESRNTLENAENVKAIIGEEPFFLVTSAYHMPRAILAFQQKGTNPIPTPADFKVGKSLDPQEAKFKYDLFDFIPGNFQKVNLAFHEYLGILFYRAFNHLSID